MKENRPERLTHQTPPYKPSKSSWISIFTLDPTAWSHMGQLGDFNYSFKTKGVITPIPLTVNNNNLTRILKWSANNQRCLLK